MSRPWLAPLALMLVLVSPLGAASAQAAGDAAAGRKAFEAYCARCHSLDPTERGKRGPDLAGLLQRRYGAVAGFPYRMVWPQADPKWTPAHLDAYLEIHRLAEPQVRADVIAFLVAATGGKPLDVALADPVAGERLYNSRCAYCHALKPEPGAPRRADRRYEEITRALRRQPWEPPPDSGSGAATETERVRRGPNLAGLLTRAPGAAAGFAYRFVYKVSGPTWTAADLDSYIEFHARLEPVERADLIAFLTKATQ
jgi:cytochrome c